MGAAPSVDGVDEVDGYAAEEVQRRRATALCENNIAAAGPAAESEVAMRRRKRRRAGPGVFGDPRMRGFSLLETLIVSLLVTVLATAVLQSLAFALQAHLRTRESWRLTLDLWNRSALTRSGPQPDGASFRPLPSARPIRLSVIENPDSGHPAKWEVLRAEK